MTNKDREDMIQRAISEYKTCKAEGRPINRIMSELHNVWIAVCTQGCVGAEELRQILLTENDKW